MKQKRYAPQYLKVVNVDRENYTIRFVFSSSRVDRHGEIIDQKGWILTNYMNNPVVLWAHDQSKFPIGKAANMSLETGNLEGDVIFAYNENPEAAIAFELAASGFLSAGSVGFMNNKWMYDQVTDVLTLLENELFEFSIVNVPANPDALAKAVDSIMEKNMDKKFIDKVVEFQAAAKKNAADRFKDLGEEVAPAAEATATTEEAPKDATPAADATATEETTTQEATPSEDEVKQALSVLFKADRDVIRASVKELNNRLNDAAEDITTSKQVDDASPTEGLKKGFSNTHINTLVRSLLGSKEKKI